MNSFYKQDKDTVHLRESPQFAVGYVLALVQLTSGLAIAWLAYETIHRSGYDALVGIYIIIPKSIALFLAPLNLLSGVYYFWKYRDDPPGRKAIVGVSMLASLLILLWADTAR